MRETTDNIFAGRNDEKELLATRKRGREFPAAILGGKARGRAHLYRT